MQVTVGVRLTVGFRSWNQLGVKGTETMFVDIVDVPNLLRGVRGRWAALILFNSGIGLQGT